MKTAQISSPIRKMPENDALMSACAEVVKRKVYLLTISPHEIARPGSFLQVTNFLILGLTIQFSALNM